MSMPPWVQLQRKLREYASSWYKYILFSGRKNTEDLWDRSHLFGELVSKKSTKAQWCSLETEQGREIFAFLDLALPQLYLHIWEVVHCLLDFCNQRLTIHQMIPVAAGQHSPPDSGQKYMTRADYMHWKNHWTEVYKLLVVSCDNASCINNAS